ncbi:hypothetical protein SLEP1_g33857 [Rubroshorea leprosula]|uniref:Secreted protein n=1 Tax=Rubroshorea leprosula TaxID=152421 RepID=A0AAV5KI92_9ROSI|nr:hypothetical protein SLEP1_g33857 [Rubroshorea leprosula]
MRFNQKKEAIFRVCSVFFSLLLPNITSIPASPSAKIEKPPDLLCFLPLCRRLLLVSLWPRESPAIFPPAPPFTASSSFAC